MSGFKTVRGMRDFLADEAQLLRYVEDRARKVATLYGYKEIITPIVESYELLSVKAGEEVRSRMFAFKDLGDRDVALRPEFTASVARLVAASFLDQPKPFRLFCVGSVYRYDEPQRGRYREFWQSNFELMGSNRPEADAEVLLLTNSLMENAGLKEFTFKIGHVGVLRGIFNQEKLEDRVHNQVMQLMDKKEYDDAFRVVQDAGAPDNCLRVLRQLVKLKGEDVFNVVEKMKACVFGYEDAIVATENLRQILELISKSGCRITLNVDAGFARGLEYYTGMIFEVYIPTLSIALGGGGRYDRLIELFGGESTPAVGVAHGVDRIMLAIQQQKVPLGTDGKKSGVVIPINEQLKAEALKIAEMLREAGLAVEIEIMGRKMAKALEDANRRKMNYAVIIGERELKEGTVAIRDLARREQKTVLIEKAVETINEMTAT